MYDVAEGILNNFFSVSIANVIQADLSLPVRPEMRVYHVVKAEEEFNIGAEQFCIFYYISPLPESSLTLGRGGIYRIDGAIVFNIISDASGAKAVSSSSVYNYIKNKYQDFTHDDFLITGAGEVSRDVDENNLESFKFTVFWSYFYVK